MIDGSSQQAGPLAGTVAVDLETIWFSATGLAVCWGLFAATFVISMEEPMLLLFAN